MLVFTVRDLSELLYFEMSVKDAEAVEVETRNFVFPKKNAHHGRIGEDLQEG